MKLTKTASGKQNIKMSKSEWQAIGQKAGWTKKAMFDAPDPDWHGGPGTPSDSQDDRNDRVKEFIGDNFSKAVDDAIEYMNIDMEDLKDRPRENTVQFVAIIKDYMEARGAEYSELESAAQKLDEDFEKHGIPFDYGDITAVFGI